MSRPGMRSLYGPQKADPPITWQLKKLEPDMRIVLKNTLLDKILKNVPISPPDSKMVGGEHEDEEKPVVFVRTCTPLSNDYPTILIRHESGKEEQVIAIGYVFCDGADKGRHICQQVNTGKTKYGPAGQNFHRSNPKAHTTNFGKRKPQRIW